MSISESVSEFSEVGGALVAVVVLIVVPKLLLHPI